jgi:hypothetical protein
MGGHKVARLQTLFGTFAGLRAANAGCEVLRVGEKLHAEILVVVAGFTASRQSTQKLQNAPWGAASREVVCGVARLA